MGTRRLLKQERFLTFSVQRCNTLAMTIVDYLQSAQPILPNQWLQWQKGLQRYKTSLLRTQTVRRDTNEGVRGNDAV